MKRSKRTPIGEALAAIGVTTAPTTGGWTGATATTTVATSGYVSERKAAAELARDLRTLADRIARVVANTPDGPGDHPSWGREAHDWMRPRE